MSRNRGICIIVAVLILFVHRSLGQAAEPKQLSRVRVSDNRRFLVTEDGKPFFYLADTAWELFHRLKREEVEKYLADRAGKGFNVIQAVVLAELDGLTEPNAYGHLPLADKTDPTRPAIQDGPHNDYWDNVDEVIDLAAQKGLYMGLLPTWGRYVTSHWANGIVDGIFTPANAQQYGEFIGKRYKDRRNIIWIIGGDRAAPTKESQAIWRALAKGIAIGVSGREDYDAVLMTYHTSGPGHASDFFHEDPWLDFTSIQSSHGNRILNWKMIERDYNRRPIKPVIDLETTYPDALIMQGMQPGNDDHARRSAYWSVFAGACGHTYGHNSIWQMFAPGRTPILNPQSHWYEAIYAPSAAQMGFLRKLIESRPFLSRVPDQSLLASDAGDDIDHLRAIRGDGYAMIYSPNGRSFTVHLDRFSDKTIRAWWFDPRTGSSKLLGEFPKQGDQEFDPPGEPTVGNDWVLVLDDAEQAFGPPCGATETYDWQGSGAYDTYEWSGFLLANNRWGGGEGRMFFKEGEKTWSFWTEHADEMLDGQVKSFPHAGIGWFWGNWAPNKSLPIKLGELEIAKADWSLTLPEQEKAQSYVAYFQLYTSNDADPGREPSNITGDLAPIVYREDFPFEDWGTKVGTFELANQTRNIIHKAPAIGKSTYIIMAPATNTKRVGNRVQVKDFDLKACIDFCLKQGYVQSSDYLVTVQIGWEVRALQGIIRSDDLRITMGKNGEAAFHLPLDGE